MTVHTTILNDAVLSRLMALQSMDIARLRTAWHDLYKSEPARHSIRSFLIKRLSYRIQELAYGGDSTETQARLAAHAKRYCNNRGSMHSIKLPGPGSILTRVYRGVEHQVLVLEDGTFQYNGCRFSSLSSIAKHITGMSWNGLEFFGLKQRVSSAKAP